MEVRVLSHSPSLSGANGQHKSLVRTRFGFESRLRLHGSVGQLVSPPDCKSGTSETLQVRVLPGPPTLLSSVDRARRFERRGSRVRVLQQGPTGTGVTGCMAPWGGGGTQFESAVPDQTDRGVVDAWLLREEAVAGSSPAGLTKRHWCSGNTGAFQASVAGSSPA